MSVRTGVEFELIVLFPLMSLLQSKQKIICAFCRQTFNYNAIVIAVTLIHI